MGGVSNTHNNDTHDNNTHNNDTHDNWRNLTQLCWNKAAHLERLQALWCYVYDILEKAKI
jgi:hypothetical protein